MALYPKTSARCDFHSYDTRQPSAAAARHDTTAVQQLGGSKPCASLESLFYILRQRHSHTRTRGQVSELGAVYQECRAFRTLLFVDDDDEDDDDGSSQGAGGRGGGRGRDSR